MKKLIFLVIIFSHLCTYSQTIESELNKLIGVFVGEWTTYKLNGKGEIVIVNSWKDTLHTNSPIINDSLAYVNVNSIMHFENEDIPPYKMQFKEGYKISDNEILCHFFNIMGTEFIEHNINNHTYVISQQISPFELNQFGIKNASEATNTTVKEIINVNGEEIHKISRISTIVWTENSEEKNIQFVSLKGFHKRIE